MNLFTLSENKYDQFESKNTQDIKERDHEKILRKMNKKQLVSVCKTLRLSGYSRLKKTDLIHFITRNKPFNTPTDMNSFDVSDIELFYIRSPRHKNDEYNKKRENILCAIGNHQIPSSYLSDTIYKEKWDSIIHNFNKCISELYDGDGMYDFIQVLKKAGRHYNFDFSISFLLGGECLQVKSIEFKYGKSIFKYPQFLSLYITNSKSNFVTKSFIDFWYDNYLDEYLSYIDQLSKPCLPEYKRMINDTVGNHTFIHELKKTMELRNRHDKLRMDTVVNQCISDFIMDVDFDIHKLQSIFNVQNDKIFVCCSDGEFTTQTLSNYLNLSNVSITRKHNCIVITNRDPGYSCKIKLLLRWKNGKGVAGPAWQIGVSRTG